MGAQALHAAFRTAALTKQELMMLTWKVGSEAMMIVASCGVCAMSSTLRAARIDTACCFQDCSRDTARADDADVEDKQRSYDACSI